MRRRLNRCADQWLREALVTEDLAPSSRPPGVARSAGAVRRWLPWSLAGVLLVAATAATVTAWPHVFDPEAVAATGTIGQWRARMGRAQLLGSPHASLWRWSGDAADRGSGDIVWDNERQRGFLLLRGFVVNDPARARYQVWIFDAARDDRYPIDGGLFDVPAGRDEVVIPVRSPLPVLRPVAFAVTVERPSGVVVSDRTKVVAFAQAGD